MAKADGPDGDGIEVEVSAPTGEDVSGEAFTVTVRKGDQSETFENVTAKKGRQNVATMVNATVQARRAPGDGRRHR